MKLYKYVAAQVGEKILREQKLRFTQLIALNDPFEANPFLSVLTSKEEFHNFINQLLKKAGVIDLVIEKGYASAIKKNPKIELINKNALLSFFKTTVLNKYSSYDNMFDEIVLNNRESFSKFLTFVTNSYFDVIKNHIGVLSLSANSQNLIMWSHYADNSQGLVLEIESENPFFLQPPGPFARVIPIAYNEKRQKTEFNIFMTNVKDAIDLLNSIFFNKDKHWEDEEEYRCIKLFTNETLSKCKDIYDCDIHLFPFPKDLIKGIIFGHRMQENKITEFIALLKSCEYRNVELSKIILDKVEYKLIPERIGMT